MKRLFYLIALGAILFASCAKTDNPNPNEEKTYSFEIGAEKETDGTDETRIEMIDNALHWSIGDQVGMCVHQGNTIIVNNLAMSGLHTAPTRSTTFKGELTQSQISALNPNRTYGYFTYFPYQSNNLLFNPSNSSISYYHSAITVRKNEFPNSFMMYAYGDNAPPMTWLDDNGEQQWSERTKVKYKHGFAYVRLKLNRNSTGIPVTIVQVAASSNNDNPGGSFTFNYKQGIWSGLTRGTSPFNVTIEGGFNVGDEIYFPLIPDTYGYQMTFKFYRVEPNRTTWTNVNTPSSITFERGKIYTISFNI